MLYSEAFMDGYKDALQDVDVLYDEVDEDTEEDNFMDDALLEQMEYIEVVQEEFDKYFSEEDVIRYLVQTQGYNINEAYEIYNEGFLRNMILKRTNPNQYALEQRAKQERKVRDAQDNEQQAQSNYATVVSRQGYDPNSAQDTKMARGLQKKRNKAMQKTDKAVTTFNKQTTPKQPGFITKAVNAVSAFANRTAMKFGKAKFERQSQQRPTMNQTPVVKTASNTPIQQTTNQPRIQQTTNNTRAVAESIFIEGYYDALKDIYNEELY